MNLQLLESLGSVPPPIIEEAALGERGQVSGLEDGSPPSMGIAIPSYRDGQLAIDFCRSLLEMRNISTSLFVAVVSNGPRDDCFESIQGLRDEFAARGWRFEHDHNDERGKCPAWDRAEDLIGDQCVGIIYLDADIRINEAAINRIAERMAAGTEPLLLAPQAQVKVSKNALVSAYGNVWSELPHVRRDVVGAGCFAVTREGRLRWGRWPVVFADDTFVRFKFGEEERRVIERIHFDISLPEKTMDLIRIRARWIQGYRLLVENFPCIGCKEDRRWGEAMRHFVLRPRMYPSCAVFALIWFAAKVFLLFSGDAATRDWARAESTGVRREVDR